MSPHASSAGRARAITGLVSVFVLLLTVLVAIADSPASGTVPGANGKIAYQRGSSIWTMNADGTGQAALTNTGPIVVSTHHEPAWSPDGTKIAYRYDSFFANDDIVVVNADGSGGVNVTNTAGIDEFEPTWSPDGTKIAYRRGNSIWTMNADGTGQAALTNTGLIVASTHHEPAWSPDGTKIAYRNNPTFPLTGTDDIYVVNADGSGGVNVTNTTGIDEFEPTWQPLNRPPIAVDDMVTVPTGGSATIDLAANDSDPDGDGLTADKATDPVHGTVARDGVHPTRFVYSHDGSTPSVDTFTYTLTDEHGATSAPATVTINVSPIGHDVGLVDPATGIWYLRDADTAAVTNFFYGNPADIAFMGDWDCDGVDTPGLFRQSDAFAYLRNSNSQGIADIRFFFGNPDDVPIVGDFNGDGCDTLSIYRPSQQRFYIINRLGENEGGLGAADFFFDFGNPGDKAVAGDWDGDGMTEVGLHRESTGFFYYRNTLDTGIASAEFFFGDPGDRFVAGDWGVVDRRDSPAVFRPSNVTFFFKHDLTQGVADSQFVWIGAGSDWRPVSGRFGL